MTEISDRAVLEQAAEWYVALQDPQIDEACRERWRAWMAGGAAQRTAWESIENVSRRFGLLQCASSEMRGLALRTLNSPRPAHGRRKFVGGLLAVLCATGLGMTAGLRNSDERASWRADYRSARGEVREFMLSDGSHLWLNTSSAIGATLDSGIRCVRLIAGEVLIQTAPDRTPVNRDFVVDTGRGRVRALGTRFIVQERSAGIFVAVFEGAVELAPAEGGKVVLNAGEEAVFNEQGVSQRGKTDPSRKAWSRGVLVAEGRTLVDLVTEINRYRDRDIEVAPEVAMLNVVGVFPISGLAQVERLLEQALPLRAQALSDGRVRLVSAAVSKARIAPSD